MPSYQMFADFYDSLTDNVQYEERADYIVNILEKKHNHNLGLTLDLACGTGTLTILLKEKGVDIYGVDASEEMLSIACEKSYEKNLDILFLRQSMEELDLYGTVDTCICTLDSLNHIVDEKSLERAFERLSVFMNKGGYFLFDLNTVYKHQRVLGDNAFIFETDEVFCTWQNTLLDNNVVDIDLDFFVKYGDCYKRYSEYFQERAYSIDFIENLLKKTGFSLEAVYGDMTEIPPVENEERIIVVAKKI